MKKRGMTPTQARNLRLKQGLQESKLQRLRVKKGLSQAELAKISGVSKRTIQFYEAEKQVIDNAKLKTLCSLSDSLGVTIGDILEGNETLEKYNRVK